MILSTMRSGRTIERALRAARAKATVEASGSDIDSSKATFERYAERLLRRLHVVRA